MMCAGMWFARGASWTLMVAVIACSVFATQNINVERSNYTLAFDREYLSTAALTKAGTALEISPYEPEFAPYLYASMTKMTLTLATQSVGMFTTNSGQLALKLHPEHMFVLEPPSNGFKYRASVKPFAPHGSNWTSMPTLRTVISLTDNTVVTPFDSEVVKFLSPFSTYVFSADLSDPINAGFLARSTSMHVHIEEHIRAQYLDSAAALHADLKAHASLRTQGASATIPKLMTLYMANGPSKVQGRTNGYDLAQVLSVTELNRFFYQHLYSIVNTEHTLTTELPPAFAVATGVIEPATHRYYHLWKRYTSVHFALLSGNLSLTTSATQATQMNFALQLDPSRTYATFDQWYTYYDADGNPTDTVENEMFNIRENCQVVNGTKRRPCTGIANAKGVITALSGVVDSGVSVVLTFERSSVQFDFSPDPTVQMTIGAQLIKGLADTITGSPDGNIGMVVGRLPTNAAGLQTYAMPRSYRVGQLGTEAIVILIETDFSLSHANDPALRPIYSAMDPLALDLPLNAKFFDGVPHTACLIIGNHYFVDRVLIGDAKNTNYQDNVGGTVAFNKTIVYTDADHPLRTAYGADMSSKTSKLLYLRSCHVRESWPCPSSDDGPYTINAEFEGAPIKIFGQKQLLLQSVPHTYAQYMCGTKGSDWVCHSFTHYNLYYTTTIGATDQSVPLSIINDALYAKASVGMTMSVDERERNDQSTNTCTENGAVVANTNNDCAKYFASKFQGSVTVDVNGFGLLAAKNVLYPPKNQADQLFSFDPEQIYAAGDLYLWGHINTN